MCGSGGGGDVDEEEDEDEDMNSLYIQGISCFCSTSEFVCTGSLYNAPSLVYPDGITVDIEQDLQGNHFSI